MCQKILWPALTRPSSQHADFLCLPTCIFSTEGALRLPTTIDNHPSHPSIRPSVTKPPNHLKRPWIDLSRPPMTSNYNKWLTAWLLSANRIHLCGRVPILMTYQGHREFPPNQTKLLSLIVAWSSSDFISCFMHQDDLTTFWLYLDDILAMFRLRSD